MDGKFNKSLRPVLRSLGIAPREANPRIPRRGGLQVVLPMDDGLAREIGTLRQEGNWFVFRYEEHYQGDPLRAFPDLHREYKSDVLWPFFAVRIPSLKRPEIKRFVEKNKIDTNDTMALLERLGMRVVSNPFELRSLAG